MKRTVVGTAIMLALLAAPLAAPAQQKSAIQLSSTSQVAVTEKNAQEEKETRLQDAAKAKVVPGDTVIFTTSYVNTSDKPVNNVTIMNPVPQHMAYVEKSAEGKGARIDFSVDGGKTYASPDKLTVKDTAGKVRPALGQDYTHIRWVLAAPLAPGGKGSVSFKAKLQ